MLILEYIIPDNETMWQKLKVFINVAEHAGFAKAASKLGLSKASVTRYIKELELEYNAKFFTRTTRHVSLTQQGESFYHSALEMLQIHEDAYDNINKAANTVQGHIKIGLPISILQQFAQSQIPKLAQNYPDLLIKLSRLRRQLFPRHSYHPELSI